MRISFRQNCVSRYMNLDTRVNWAQRMLKLMDEDRLEDQAEIYAN